jgi:hypothetical protein
MQLSTRGLALQENPIGQLAWMAEKFIACQFMAIIAPSDSLTLVLLPIVSIVSLRSSCRQTLVHQHHHFRLPPIPFTELPEFVLYIRLKPGRIHSGWEEGQDRRPPGLF